MKVFMIACPEVPSENILILATTCRLGYKIVMPSFPFRY